MWAIVDAERADQVRMQRAETTGVYIRSRRWRHCREAAGARLGHDRGARRHVALVLVFSRRHGQPHEPRPHSGRTPGGRVDCWFSAIGESVTSSSSPSQRVDGGGGATSLLQAHQECLDVLLPDRSDVARHADSHQEGNQLVERLKESAGRAPRSRSRWSWVTCSRRAGAAGSSRAGQQIRPRGENARRR